MAVGPGRGGGCGGQSPPHSRPDAGELACPDVNGWVAIDPWLMRARPLGDEPSSPLTDAPRRHRSSLGEHERVAAAWRCGARFLQLRRSALPSAAPPRHSEAVNTRARIRARRLPSPGTNPGPAPVQRHLLFHAPGDTSGSQLQAVFARLRGLRWANLGSKSRSSQVAHQTGAVHAGRTTGLHSSAVSPHAPSSPGCSGGVQAPRGSDRSRSSWPRSQGSSGRIGSPQRRHKTTPSSTRSCRRSRSAR